MKITALAAASLATLAAAAPAEKRQSCTYGFVFARGSTEPSPLVSRHNYLKDVLGANLKNRVYSLGLACRAR
jgi:hypothetical protein